jgi:hypothetical protein
MGGLLLFIGGVGEWILGNNFPATGMDTPLVVVMKTIANKKLS